MLVKIISEFLKIARTEFVKYPSQYTAATLFLWGVLVLLFSISLSHILLAVPCLLVVNGLAIVVVYVGFAKSVEKKRIPFGVALGSIILLLTLTIDTLFIASL